MGRLHRSERIVELSSASPAFARKGDQSCSPGGEPTALLVFPLDREPSDETLLVRISDGDNESLALLFRRYARIVRGVAYKVLRDSSEADDLLQDIFLLIHRSCRTFDSSKGSARFWILQMTQHRAITRRRYLISRHFYTRVDLDDVGRELAAHETDGLATEGLEKAFEGLSDNQRRTLELFFVEGYTLGEIATKLNQTRGNVKNHYFRGLEKLRKQIFGSKVVL